MNFALFSRRLLRAAHRLFACEPGSGLARFQPALTRTMFAHRRVAPTRLLRQRHSQGW